MSFFWYKYSVARLMTLFLCRRSSGGSYRLGKLEKVGEFE